MGGQPRTALGRNSPRRGVRQWLAAMALNAGRLVADRDNRQQLIEEVCKSLGVAKRLSREAVRQRLQLMLDEPQRSARGVEGDVAANVSTLGKLLELTAVEQDVLRFVTMLRVDDNLAAAAGYCEARTEQSFMAALGKILGHGSQDVREALEWEATLIEHQVVESCDGFWNLGDRLQVKAALGRRLAGRRTRIDELVRGFFCRAPAPTLKLSDFSHMAEDVQLMLDYVRAAAVNGEVGVNVLLYGLPGTGKTELSRVAAAELGWPAFEVNMEEDDGTPATPKARIASYRMAQRYLAKRRHRVVVFDEMEDAFGGNDDFGGALGASRPFGKLWMNKCLEANAVPTIWIANRVDTVDTAHLRRFDLALRFSTLPRAVRTRMIERHFGDLVVDKQQLVALHARSDVVPSQVAMAAKVARNAAPRRNSGATLIRALDSSMRLMGQEVPDSASDARQFDAGLVNVNVDFNSVVAGLKHGGGRGSVLLTGPAGSGKSAFARHIATVLWRDAKAISASDLLVLPPAAAIQRIAYEFAEAAAMERVLEWEEAEVLFPLKTARSSVWEFAIASEMLAQMEHFVGLAFFATSAPSTLDIAAMQRFDLKLTFDYLRIDQRLKLWNAAVDDEHVEVSAASVDRLQRLEQLTPGDFVAIGRRAACVGAIWKRDEWLAALEEEHGRKLASGSGIGFTVGR